MLESQESAVHCFSREKHLSPGFKKLFIPCMDSYLFKVTPIRMTDIPFAKVGMSPEVSTNVFFLLLVKFKLPAPGYGANT